MLPTLRYADSALGRIQPAPLLTAALAQASACTAAYTLVSSYGIAWGIAWLWIAGALAAVAGWLMRLPWWWAPINLLLPPAGGFLLAVHVPAGAYLVAFIALWVANAGAWRNRVPLYLSSQAAIRALLALLPARPGFHFCDLGCGTGAVVSGLAAARPDGRYCGFEISPLTFVVSWLRTRRCKAAIQFGDFWNVDLASFDIVYVYLSPAVMPRLWQKARREMRPGTLLVSNSFEIPGVPPHDTLYGHRDTLYVWRM